MVGRRSSNQLDLEPDTVVIPPDACEASQLPKAVRWVGVAGYGVAGSNSVGFTLPGDTSDAKLAKIQVSEPGKVGLVLAAYESHVWQISVAPGTQVVGVVAMGHHRQQVMGLTKGTPVAYATFHGKSPCGYTYSAEGASAKLKTLTGTTPERIEELSSIVTLGAGAGPFTSDPGDLDVQRYNRKLTMFSGGRRGVQEALQQGYLRRASESEVQDARGLMSGPNVESVGASEAYVLTKAMVLPAGLAGGNGAGTLFIVPKGIALPRGDKGHTVIIDLNTRACISALCYR